MSNTIARSAHTLAIGALSKNTLCLMAAAEPDLGLERPSGGALPYVKRSIDRRITIRLRAHPKSEADGMVRSMHCDDEMGVAHFQNRNKIREEASAVIYKIETGKDDGPDVPVPIWPDDFDIPPRQDIIRLLD